MSYYMQKELMNKIFTRLPINSILRCTSVCKSWIQSDNEDLL
uniref:F-box domain-containing protein n=1 Tax=Solanum lycopersicum TaxID=4081 RepID=A0A3Q7HC71_SOLLC